ncbi:RNA-binding domain-containing protein [Tilletiaria anomala UBC 951]|uniref:RNA-binding domain-containing protein n=1 Tax=Tilletiaria anomala (strain ATCC 24038 / CBS 436.72 / UBC 951) TaxID=1037660 RepID=A0A066VAM5_TILAU|nr:RNA-binding domain-containing protein [Tilletiaria anomala UBC 951]KDN38521.1 RNA-binding domain-containing protein [Tilletiaria anomala UBC 951]
MSYQPYDYSYAQSSAAGSSTDPYAAFYSWDATTNQWTFDYDGYYRAYGSYPAAADGSGGYSAADLSTQASAYNYDAAGYASTSGTASATPGVAAATDADGKPKKFVPGPKDADGNPLAGKLQKGETRTTVLRKAAGKIWEDPTLLEWDPTHKRLFIGDLGNDVTDEVLTAAFEKYSSFAKARVVRKKGDLKSKGYGFVAFADPEDFLKAWKEMDGKYVGSRPIRIKKAQDTQHVDIGYRKDRLLASNNRYEAYVKRTKMGGAVGKDLRNPATGKAYGQKR